MSSLYFLRTLAAAAVLLPLIASAHVFPERSSPGAGATLIAPPASVRIQFDGAIEVPFSRLDVTDAQGNSVVAAPATGDGGDVLESKLKALAPGRYGVHWSVVGRDGHRTEGSYTFVVTPPKR